MGPAVSLYCTLLRYKRKIWHRFKRSDGKAAGHAARTDHKNTLYTSDRRTYLDEREQRLILIILRRPKARWLFNRHQSTVKVECLSLWENQNPPKILTPLFVVWSVPHLAIHDTDFDVWLSKECCCFCFFFNIYDKSAVFSTELEPVGIFLLHQTTSAFFFKKERCLWQQHANIQHAQSFWGGVGVG